MSQIPLELELKANCKLSHMNAGSFVRRVCVLTAEPFLQLLHTEFLTTISNYLIALANKLFLGALPLKKFPASPHVSVHQEHF
jgi:hypothetical protein